MSISERFSTASGLVTDTLIVFEAGPTHTGLQSATQLARLAKEAGANAIKFQVTDHNKLIADKQLSFGYSVVNADGSTETVNEPLIDIWERRWMSKEDWRQLFDYCASIDLEAFATVFSIEDVDFAVSCGLKTLKIASQDTNFRQLISYAASTGLPIQLDTGGSTFSEIERAVSWVMMENNHQVIKNHCQSLNPARL